MPGAGLSRGWDLPPGGLNPYQRSPILSRLVRSTKTGAGLVRANWLAGFTSRACVAYWLRLFRAGAGHGSNTPGSGLNVCRMPATVRVKARPTPAGRGKAPQPPGSGRSSTTLHEGVRLHHLISMLLWRRRPCFVGPVSWPSHRIRAARCGRFWPTMPGLGTGDPEAGRRRYRRNS